MNDRLGYKNISIAIPEDMRNKLNQNLQYGQLTQLITLFLENIEHMIDTDTKVDYITWAYGNHPLTLKTKKELSDE